MLLCQGVTRDVSSRLLPNSGIIIPLMRHSYHPSFVINSVPIPSTVTRVAGRSISAEKNSKIQHVPRPKCEKPSMRILSRHCCAHLHTVHAIRDLEYFSVSTGPQ
jgi:hypothetical protein